MAILRHTIERHYYDGTRTCNTMLFVAPPTQDARNPAYFALIRYERSCTQHTGMDVVDSAVDGGAESALMEDEAEPEDSGIVVPHLHQPAPRRHCTCALRHGLRSLRQWWGTREVLALCRLAIPIVSHIFEMRATRASFCVHVCVHDRMCAPLQVVMLFFQQLLFLISLLFVGHITGESLELDAAGTTACLPAGGFTQIMTRLSLSLSHSAGLFGKL